MFFLRAASFYLSLQPTSSLISESETGTQVLCEING